MLVHANDCASSIIITVYEMISFKLSTETALAHECQTCQLYYFTHSYTHEHTLVYVYQYTRTHAYPHITCSYASACMYIR